MCYCRPHVRTPCCGPTCCGLPNGCAFCAKPRPATQTAPPEVRHIVEWLRSDRFASWSQVGEIAEMIENGDACLDGRRPWEARLPKETP